MTSISSVARVILIVGVWWWTDMQSYCYTTFRIWVLFFVAKLIWGGLIDGEFGEVTLTWRAKRKDNRIFIFLIIGFQTGTLTGVCVVEGVWVDLHDYMSEKERRALGFGGWEEEWGRERPINKESFWVFGTCCRLINRRKMVLNLNMSLFYLLIGWAVRKHVL